MESITKYTPEGYQFSGDPKTITEDRVFAFSGGFPRDPEWPKKTMHTSLEFAKSCGLPSRVVSGAMPEGYLTELMLNLFGEAWLQYGSMSLTFTTIVSPGETLIPKAVVQSRQEEESGVRFVLEVWCENQDGIKVAVGTVTGLVQ